MLSLLTCSMLMLHHAGSYTNSKSIYPCNSDSYMCIVLAIILVASACFQALLLTLRPFKSVLALMHS